MAVLPFPARKPTSALRNKRMHVCLTGEEENLLEDLARRKGVSRGSYLRMCLWAVYKQGGV
jgi:hypothetical protein